MKIALTLGFSLIAYLNTTLGQDYNDLIVSKKGDSLHCIISLIDDENIAYKITDEGVESLEFISLTFVAIYIQEGVLTNTSEKQNKTKKSKKPKFFPCM